VFEQKRRFWLICCCDTPNNLRKYSTMCKNTVVKLSDRDIIDDPLTELLRADAQQLIKPTYSRHGRGKHALPQTRYAPSCATPERFGEDCRGRFGMTAFGGLQHRQKLRWRISFLRHGGDCYLGLDCFLSYLLTKNFISFICLRKTSSKTGKDKIQRLTSCYYDRTARYCFRIRLKNDVLFGSTDLRYSFENTIPSLISASISSNISILDFSMPFPVRLRVM